MDKIIIKLSMFSLFQTIYIQHGEEIQRLEYKFEDLPEIISKSNVKEVHIFGQEAYAKKLKIDTRAKFSIDDIEWFYNK